MTIAYTLTGLTFGGTQLQRSDLSVFLEVSVGLDEVANWRMTDTIIPTLTGRISRLGRADTLDIELAGIVQGNLTTDEDSRLGSFRTIAEELKTLFVPGPPSVLTGTGKDGATYSINAKPVPTGALRWGPQTIPGFRELTVLLVSLDPDWDVSGGS